MATVDRKVKQLLAEARVRCCGSGVGGMAAPVLRTHKRPLQPGLANAAPRAATHSNHGRKCPVSGQKQPQPVAPALLESAAVQAVAAASTAVPPATVTAVTEAAAGDGEALPCSPITVARLDSTDCQVLELLQQAAEEAAPWDNHLPSRSRGGSLAAGLQQPVHWSRRGDGGCSPHRHRGQRQPQSPLAQQLAALRRSVEPGGGAALDACSTASTATTGCCGATAAEGGLGAAAEPAPSSCAAPLTGQPASYGLQQLSAGGAAAHAASPAALWAACADVSAGSAQQPAAGAMAASAASADARAAEEASALELREHCLAGRYEEARQALRSGGPQLVEAADSEGRRPLMLASSAGHGRLVKLLLRKGAAIDSRDSQGNSALMLAVVHGHRAVARHLLQCGADAGRRNAAGMTAADLVAAWAAQGSDAAAGDAGEDG